METIFINSHYDESFLIQEGQNITSITIPEDVTTIGRMAFARCSNLASVFVQMSIPIPINYDDNVFYETKQEYLYVPSGCKEAYKNANC